MATQVDTNVFFDTFNITPNIDVTILITSDHTIAQVAETRWNQLIWVIIWDHRVSPSEIRPKALTHFLNLVYELEVERIKQKHLPDVGANHNLLGVFAEIETYSKAILEFTSAFLDIVSILILEQIDVLILGRGG